MTDEARKVLVRAQLEHIAATLAVRISRQYLRQSAVGPRNTVRNVLQKKDHRISTLVELADGANMDVEIVFRERP